MFPNSMFSFLHQILVRITVCNRIFSIYLFFLMRQRHLIYFQQSDLAGTLKMNRKLVNCSVFLTSLSFKAKKPSACVLTDTLARSGNGTLAFTWQVFWSARTTLFFVSKKIRAAPFKPDKLLTLVFVL